MYSRMMRGPSSDPSRTVQVKCATRVPYPARPAQVLPSACVGTGAESQLVDPRNRSVQVVFGYAFRRADCERDDLCVHGKAAKRLLELVNLGFEFLLPHD